MKFLYKNEKTRSLLVDWAKGKTLVSARFFFWKPGAPLHKNLTSLVQSIFYHILCQIPEYLETLFPKYWEPSEYQIGNNRPSLHIEKDEIFAAFDALIHYKDIYESHQCLILNLLA
jgi:hypothetical protein